MNPFQRAKQLLQGKAAAPAAKTQYYHVSCPEGHRLSGPRTMGYQALRCPNCGAGVFVLPRSPLPEPAAASPQRSSNAFARQQPELGEAPDSLTDPVPFTEVREMNPDLEIEWEEDDAPARAVAGSTAQKTAQEGPRPARTTNRPARSRSRTKAVAFEDERAVVMEASEDARARLADWVRQRRNPLIFGGVALVVAATIGVRLWRTTVEDSPRKVEIGRTLGLAALDEGRFDAAHKYLAEAAHAVDVLGGRVEGADEVRQGAKEAAIYTSLLADSLETLLARADPAESSDWSAQFDRLYKGRSLIIDATVTRVPGVTGSTRYELDYCILAAGSGPRPRVGRIETKGFQHIEAIQPKVGNRVVFGARLASFTLDSASDEWRIGLEPASGVEMMHPKALAVLGWPSGEEGGPEDPP